MCILYQTSAATNRPPTEEYFPDVTELFQVLVLPATVYSFCAYFCIFTLHCCGQQVEGGDSAPLLRSGETPPTVLRPALDRKSVV